MQRKFENQKPSDYKEKIKNPFVIGDLVYVQDSSGRCDKSWNGPHRVSNIISRVSFEVNNDGVSRHINHGRVVPESRKEIESDEDTDFEIPTKERRYPEGS